MQSVNKYAATSYNLGLKRLQKTTGDQFFWRQLAKQSLNIIQKAINSCVKPGLLFFQIFIILWAYEPQFHLPYYRVPPKEEIERIKSYWLNADTWIFIKWNLSFIGNFVLFLFFAFNQRNNKSIRNFHAFNICVEWCLKLEEDKREKSKG